MELIRKILNRLIFPGTAIVIISVPIAAALLIYTFLFGHEYRPISYTSYFISAYSLIIVCAKIIKVSKTARVNVKTALYKNRLTHRYLTDVTFKIHVSLYLSLGINLIYAVIKFVSGLYYHSVWFATLGVYYTLLAVMRFLLLYHVHQNTFGKDQVLELKRYRMCGIILMIMNIALAGVVVLVVLKNEGFNYAGYLIYIMAMYAFYTTITAVINVIKYRKYNSPIMSAAKIISLAAALVSMLSLETAMLVQFGSENSESFRQMMTGATGAAVCMIVLVLAAFMIINSTISINKLKKLDSINRG